MKAKHLLILAVCIGASIGTYIYISAGPLTITDCMDKAYVQVTVTGGKPSFAPDAKLDDPHPILINNIDDNTDVNGLENGSTIGDPTHVRVTVSMQSTAPAGLVFTIPCGMVILNDEQSGQRLIVAKTVTFAFGTTSRYQSANVETYCIDEFGTAPTPISSLAFQPYTYYDSERGKELNPVRELVQFLQGRGESHENAQAALWLLGNGNLDRSPDKTYAQLYRDFYQYYYSQTVEKWHALANTFAKGWQQHATSDNSAVALADANRGSDDFRQNKLRGRIDSHAMQQASDELKLFKTNGRRILLEWNPSLKSRAFFQS